MIEAEPRARIEILSDELASRIAAGEVVERPASVVKELIENSLDAGATEIFLWIEKSGTSLIRVTDNGVGMAAADLELAVERHATSKLKQDEDLFRIATLGFRGEALPSIGSVSKMAISSRLQGAANGYRIAVDGGQKAEIRPVAAAIGTTVEVRDIFFSTPARRKFLKSPATELSHICDVVNRMALAHPEVHFRLQHEGRTIADYASVADPQNRMFQVLGRDLAKGLIPFCRSQGNLEVHGFLSSTPASYPNARYLYTFVNRRCVRDRVLSHAVLLGYDTLLMKGRYPVSVVFLDLPYEDVDANVHPAKLEVRFRRQSEVHEAVSRAIRGALQREAKVPASHDVSPEWASWPTVSESALPYTGHTVGVGVECSPSPGSFFNTRAQTGVERGDGFFSSMRVIGQILGCYLVCVSERGLVLIDQHAAHERIAFEKLRTQLAAGRVETQSLLIPQSVELSAGEMTLLEQKREMIATFGFELEPFGPGAYAITGAPAIFPEGDYRPVVREMIAELAEVEASAKLRQHLEDRLATIACHNVIRANRTLEIDEMRALLQDLDQIPFATQCPHGRPVLIEFRREELERLFKRIV